MELYVNTKTRACNVNPEHLIEKSDSGAEILKLSISEEVYRILTVKLNYQEYLTKIDELIKCTKITELIKSEFCEEIKELELNGAEIY